MRIEDRMNVTYRQLDHWCRAGYLRPSGGNGVQRNWSTQEIRIGRMMSHLVAIGITPSKAALYARLAIVEHKWMLLEFRDGKLRVRGPFSEAIRAAIFGNYQQKESREYAPGFDSQEKAG